MMKPQIAVDVPLNFYEFVEARRLKGLKVDGDSFKWKDHEYLLEPYQAFNLEGTRNEDGLLCNDEGLDVAWMCGAQVGKSIGAMLGAVWLALVFWGRYLGYFLPDEKMAMAFSSVRFKPLCLSIPELVPVWGEDPTADDPSERRKSDAKGIRSIGPSQIFFSYMGGVTSTESIPMVAQFLDEVRRMMDGDIERSHERLSHSPYPIRFQLSTAGYPEVNIDKAFRASNQNKFHSFCRCKDGVLLADCFPDCIGERLEGVTPSLKGLPRVFYVCPICKEPVANPRDGQWLAHYPEIKNIGYHIPQTLSSRQSAMSIYRAFCVASDITEFYNSKIGIPHLSKEAQIVNTEILAATVNTDLRWPTMTGEYPINCAMGIDQMFGFNCVVIRGWGRKDGATGLRKSRLLHVEWIKSDDPWERCAELMEVFDVSRCVVDSMPNGNEALRFCKSFSKGRVFLADYSYDGDKGADVCVWGDKVTRDPNRKAAEETKEKRRVRISRYHGIEWNLTKYVKRMKEQPHQKGLIGQVQDNIGKMRDEFIVEKVFWVHLQKIARRTVVIDELQGKTKQVFENIGIDPHLLHADLYCELALSRINPDDDTKGFHDYAAAEVDKGKDMGHTFLPTSVANRYQCEDCKLQVDAHGGKTPQDVAAANGFDICKEKPEE